MSSNIVPTESEEPKARQSQQSDIAKSLALTRLSSMSSNPTNDASLMLPPPAFLLSLPLPSNTGNHAYHNGAGHPASDTPMGSTTSTAPSSPRLGPIRQNSGTITPRVRPPATTLNIPGMTKSRVSPDGKIAQRDVGSKLVVIMVGLPARGKSYITKKIHRYLQWQQHETKIFNVGNRRRGVSNVTAEAVLGSSPRSSKSSPAKSLRSSSSIAGVMNTLKDDHVTRTTDIQLNDVDDVIQGAREGGDEDVKNAAGAMDHTAEFFDPANKPAAQLREKVAMDTLEELLDFLLEQGGSVGILDATNSTVERRQILYATVKEREPKLNVIFIESVCEDEKLLEANMRLKLRGPDYKDKDPETSYEDFKRRVAAYETAYIPLGERDEDKQYIKMIDVGLTIIQHRLTGFLATGILSYLSTFNLSPRQIWIVRHGQSEDNACGKIGGNSDLTVNGVNFGTVLYNFISQKRKEWEKIQHEQAMNPTPVPQQPGDNTPPYPDILGDLNNKNFCVWTSMLKRSVQTAHAFEEDDDFDIKNWEMLNELNAGSFEGLTYKEIQSRFPEEYAKRAHDKLNYIYPGVGGEGYLQVIARLRVMVREIERIKDHVLIIGHRSVCRVLMAYFMDLTRDHITDLDVPLGMLYCIEPKPYGIDFHAYKYNESDWSFKELVGYKPQKETEKGN